MCPGCLGSQSHPDRELHWQMNLLLSRLDEQQRRWYAAVESAKLGHGGDRAISRITGLHVDTIRRRREELAASLEGRPADRVRLPGGGRPALEKSPRGLPAHLNVVGPQAGGDPMGRTKFVRRSLQALSTELAGHGYTACPTTVARLLRAQGYSPRVNVKRFTGPDHPDRDRQFRNIEEWVAVFEELGLPVISVDAKKKELIGNFKNAGATWCRRARGGQRLRLRCRRRVPGGPLRHLRPDDGPWSCLRRHLGGHPGVRRRGDRSWWARYGCKRYRGADELLILADGGGSNGHRPRLWKAALQEQIADRYGLHVTVCHYPTGASKWNPVEHRLFGPISINWAGQPLRSLEILLGWVVGRRSVASV